MKRVATTTIALITVAVSNCALLAANEIVKGEVKKIDPAANKITLTTGPIKSLDMDEDNMTMVYRVQDPAMLNQVKIGDKVQFEFQTGPDGILITKMQKAK